MQVLISDARRRGVAYLSVHGDGEPEPLGTAFFADFKWGSGKQLTYAITARHCIEGLEEPILIEMSDPHGSYRMVETKPEQWMRSDKTDVACRLMLRGDPPFNSVLDLRSDAPVAKKITPANPYRTYSGEQVYIMSLFTSSAYRETENGRSIEPIVRYGRICLPHTRALVYLDARDEGKRDKAVQVSATLIESISFAGESGAPVLACQWYPEPVVTSDIIGAIESMIEGGPATDIHCAEFAPDPPMYLYGMVSSHWRIGEKIRSGSRRKIAGEVGLNSGIAVVIPRQDIVEFMKNDPIVTRHRELIDKRSAN